MKMLTLAAALAAMALPVAAQSVPAQAHEKVPNKAQASAARKDCAKLARMQRQSPRNHRSQGEKAESAPKT